jgi:transposase
VGSSAEPVQTLPGPTLGRDRREGDRPRTRLPEWITKATDVNLPGISSFATGLHGDFDAVTAGLTTDWNSGPAEGAVSRIKLLKRQMSGRAGCTLLRKRVLLA